jgi:hypothetical protein
MKTYLAHLTLAALLGAARGTLALPPDITTQPADTAAYLGRNVTLSVTALDAAPSEFQWRFGDQSLAGATNSSLTLPKVKFTDAGPYSVVISNQEGSITSQIAWLSVLPTNVVNLGDFELQFGELSAPVWEGARKDDEGENITGDGLTIYYGSTAPGGSGNLDIWMVTRASLSSPWGTPVNLGPTVNSSGSEADPVISPDGLSLYFESNREGGRGGYDLWVTTRPSLTTPFGTPVNLGSAINSGADEDSAHVSADNLTLVFASARSGGVGALDVYMSTRTNALAPWGPAQHLPAPISSSGGTFPVALSRDGLVLFLKSWRPLSQGFPEVAAIYVSRRTNSSQPFGTPILIQSILGIGPGGADYARLSDDGTTLYIGTYRTLFPDWPQLLKLSIKALPELSAVGKNSAGEFQFDLLGREGATYQLDTSQDCVNWTPWLMTNTTSKVRLSAPGSNHAATLYRALSH